jgi:murein L,D-transpeptidase YafK
LKDADCLEIYAAAVNTEPVLIRSIRVLAASGELGPKLREGDNQVPEGVYAVESLNPNSRFHVSLRVSYPNAFDREKGRLDGRQSLGGDIMIHGGAASIGCLAVGDEAAEDIFVLTADLDLQNVTIVLCPTDLRVKNLPEVGYDWPAWYPELVAQLKDQLAKLPKTGANGEL